MTPTVGQRVQLTIQDIAFGGEGVGRWEDFVVFVSFVLTGEEVEAELTEVKKHFARARLLRVVKPSPERVAPPCPYFGDCGGCQYQHVAYEAQLRLKQKQIADLFQRIGGFDPKLVAPVVPCPQPYGYRNRIMVRSQWDKFKQGLNVGLIRYDNRLVVDIEKCLIAESALNDQLKELRAHPPPKGGLKVVLRIPPEDWEVPPDSFFQNNFFLLPRMVELVRNCVRNARRINAAPSPQPSPPMEEREKASRNRNASGWHLVDVYCGVGFLGIELADLVTSVAGVEYDQQAIAAARRNAKARGLTNVEFIAGAAEEKLPALLSRFTPAATTILLDPPRRGCDRNLLDLLRRIQPAQVVYVSCHPATMARDLNALCRDGVFNLVQALPLDMFPQTQHVECIADLRVRQLLPEQTELANAATMVSTVPAT